MKQLEAGDIVWLQTGGLAMTVYGSDGETARCDWFEHGEHKQGVFRIEQLTDKDPSK